MCKLWQKGKILQNIETSLEEMGDRVDGSLPFNVIDLSLINASED